MDVRKFKDPLKIAETRGIERKAPSENPLLRFSFSEIVALKWNHVDFEGGADPTRTFTGLWNFAGGCRNGGQR
jgi:hypothetical protein